MAKKDFVDKGVEAAAKRLQSAREAADEKMTVYPRDIATGKKLPPGDYSKNPSVAYGADEDARDASIAASDAEASNKEAQEKHTKLGKSFPADKLVAKYRKQR